MSSESFAPLGAHAAADGYLPLVARIRPPQAENASPPPLVLLLHGVGGNESNLFPLAAHMPASALVMSLRGPLVRGPDAFAWFSVEFTPEGPRINPEELEASRERVAACITAAVERYGADPECVYLFGFSQGAIISLALGLTQPALVAGVVAMAGRIPAEVLPGLAAPSATAGLPLFVAHGTRDEIIAIGEARKARRVLEEQRVALDYREYASEHDLPPEAWEAALSWLTRQVKTPTR